MTGLLIRGAHIPFPVNLPLVALITAAMAATLGVVALRVRGLYLAAGFSGHGFMHSPAIAQLVVEEMLDGKARTLDIRELSLERFITGRRPFTATVL